MPRKRHSPPSRKNAGPSLDDQVEEALASLKRMATKKTRDGMARYGIPSDHAFGVSMANIQALAKRLGRNHDLAAKLRDTGWYEARMLTAYVDEPARVTSAQMDRWCRDFDNWIATTPACRGKFALISTVVQTPEMW